MEMVFFDVFNRSLTTGWLILAVLLLRLCLKRAPGWLPCALWGLVGFRLICPFSLESALSLIPSANPVPVSILYDAAPAIQSGMTAVDTVVNGALNSSMAPVPGDSVNPMQVVSYIAARVWLVGLLAMLLYSAISTWRLRRRVRAAARIEEGVWQGDEVSSPFILGVFRPRIYLPSTLPIEDRAYVLAHERAHLKRRDHWWKPLGFALLAVHWFNPLMWVAYHLLCRDMELACDQQVTRDMAATDKQGYSSALLACGVPRRLHTASPLAFGEVGVKARVKAVLHYKKPALWLVIIAVVVCAAVGVVFLTDPVAKGSDQSVVQLDGGSTVVGVRLVIRGARLDGDKPYIELEWRNDTGSDLLSGEEFYIYRQVGQNWVDCRQTQPYAWTLIGYTVENAGPNLPGRIETRYLDDMKMDEDGLYMFKTTFHTQTATGNVQPDKQEVWVNFKVNTTPKDINLEEAQRLVIRKFNRDFRGATLTDLWYDKPYSDAEAEHWAEWYGADEAIVLLSNFVTGETYYGTGLETNATYKKWNWILVRDKGGDWELKTWGYG